MNYYIEYFTNYVFKNYDMSNPNISLKYYHTLRVAWLMDLLASKLNMSDKDRLLAFKLGLCHDLGRFYEVVRSGKFNNLTFDHGAYSNKILYNDLFVSYMDIDEHLVFRKAIHYHNKKELPKDLTRREEVFANLLRDADKIDILGIRGTKKILNFNSEPNERVLNNYFLDQSIDLKDINGPTDSTILYLGFFKDLYYMASHDIVRLYDYYKDFLKIVRVDENKQALFNSIIEKLDEKRGKVYVR